MDREVRRVRGQAYKTAREIITTNKNALDRIARKLLERETLEGWEVNQILIEETGTDYIKLKEHQEEPIGDALTIAPGSGPAPDVPTPVGQPAQKPPANSNP